MTTSPVYGLVDIPEGSEIPATSANENFRTLEQGAR